MGYCSLFGVNDWLVYLALVCIPTEDGWERGKKFAIINELSAIRLELLTGILSFD